MANKIWHNRKGKFRYNKDLDALEKLHHDEWRPIDTYGREATVMKLKGYRVRKFLYGKEWPLSSFNLYQELSKDKDYFIQVKEWCNPREYIMERIDIICDVKTALTSTEYEFSRDVLLDIYKVYNQFYLDCLSLSRKYFEDEYFMHMDYQLQNLIITKDHKVMIIDADSFQLTDSFMDWTYFDGLQILIFLLNKKLAELDQKSR